MINNTCNNRIKLTGINFFNIFFSIKFSKKKNDLFSLICSKFELYILLISSSTKTSITTTTTTTK